MHCKACDKQLGEKELIWNTELRDGSGDWELCFDCLSVAMEAAYCGEYETEDDKYVILDDVLFIDNEPVEYVGNKINSYIDEDYDIYG